MNSKVNFFYLIRESEIIVILTIYLLLHNCESYT